MKTIKINESQRKRIFEAYSEGFSFENLTVIGKGQFAGEDHSKAQIKYCSDHLGMPDNFGTSRCVFTLSDNTVLKLAYGRADVGMVQNHFEADLFRKTNSPLLAKIYACDEENYTWLVSEAVLPAREEDFEKIFGIPFGDEYKQNSRAMKKSFKYDKGDYDIGFNEYFDDIKPYNAERSDRFTMSRILRYIGDKYIHNFMLVDTSIGNMLSSDYLQEDLKKWVTELINLVKNENIADISKLENFGIVNRDGKPQVVLLDSGATMDIIKKYYQR